VKMGYQIDIICGTTTNITLSTSIHTMCFFACDLKEEKYAGKSSIRMFSFSICSSSRKTSVIMTRPTSHKVRFFIKVFLPDQYVDSL
jgi:hypothetical protein